MSSTHGEMLSLPPLLHPPEQLLMFHSSKLGLVTDGAALPLHTRNWCDRRTERRRARWPEWPKAASMQGCNGDIHSHIHPKHALANNNSNNSCYVGTLLWELKCSFELIFNDRVKRDGETVALGKKNG